MDKLEFEFIDKKEVMERLGGNDELLKRLLLSFLGTYNTSDSEITKLLKEEKYDEAYSLAHLIKGVAGNLSMKRLYNDANNLSEVIKDREYEKIMKMEKEFIKSLQFSINEIEKIKDLE